MPATYMTTPYMHTISGREVNPLDVQADDIDIDDIAHALAMQCRYNGHTAGHLSIARHCLWVAEEIRHQFGEDHQKLELHALLHDAAEAYIGDMIRPLKHNANGAMSVFCEAEDRIELVIAEVFGLDGSGYAAVKRADVEVCDGLERRMRKTWFGNALSDKAEFLRKFWELWYATH